jgi:hypothetical protein
MVTPMVSFMIASQKSEDPHLEQKPRRTFSEERNHVRCSAPRIVRLARGTSVDAQK